MEPELDNKDLGIAVPVDIEMLTLEEAEDLLNDLRGTRRRMASTV